MAEQARRDPAAEVLRRFTEMPGVGEAAAAVRAIEERAVGRLAGGSSLDAA